METNEYLLKMIAVMKEVEGLNLFPEASKLSRTEFRLLREIVIESRKGKSIISSELARRLGITRSAVSQIVTKLEKQDIVKRTASPTDKKIAYIRFSDRSLALFEEQCRQANAFTELVVKEFGEDKMNELIALYEDFTAAMRRVRAQCKDRHAE